jgi:SAM-dependent methyltransferase
MAQTDAELAPIYDKVARSYAEHLVHELDGKPLDRAWLGAFAETTAGRGRVLDAGCGPGHVASWLHSQGADAYGLDLSPGMIEVARELHPHLSFEVGSFFELGARGLAGIVAFYAIVNHPPEALPRAAASLYGALAPGGALLVSFHVGREILHLDAWWDHAVSVDFWLHDIDEVERALTGAGFVLDARLERRPYPSEHPTERAYLWAHRPA